MGCCSLEWSPGEFSFADSGRDFVDPFPLSNSVWQKPEAPFWGASTRARLHGLMVMSALAQLWFWVVVSDFILGTLLCYMVCEYNFTSIFYLVRECICFTMMWNVFVCYFFYDLRMLFLLLSGLDDMKSNFLFILFLLASVVMEWIYILRFFRIYVKRLIWL